MTKNYTVIVQCSDNDISRAGQAFVFTNLCDKAAVVKLLQELASKPVKKDCLSYANNTRIGDVSAVAVGKNTFLVLEDGHPVFDITKDGHLVVGPEDNPAEPTQTDWRNDLKVGDLVVMNGTVLDCHEGDILKIDKVMGLSFPAPYLEQKFPTGSRIKVIATEQQLLDRGVGMPGIKAVIGKTAVVHSIHTPTNLWKRPNDPQIGIRIDGFAYGSGVEHHHILCENEVELLPAELCWTVMRVTYSRLTKSWDCRFLTPEEQKLEDKKDDLP